jgi:hypothetical protein
MLRFSVREPLGECWGTSECSVRNGVCKVRNLPLQPGDTTTTLNLRRLASGQRACYTTLNLSYDGWIAQIFSHTLSDAPLCKCAWEANVVTAAE